MLPRKYTAFKKVFLDQISAGNLPTDKWEYALSDEVKQQINWFLNTLLSKAVNVSQDKHNALIKDGWSVSISGEWLQELTVSIKKKVPGCNVEIFCSTTSIEGVYYHNFDWVQITLSIVKEQTTSISFMLLNNEPDWCIKLPYHVLEATQKDYLLARQVLVSPMIQKLVMELIAD